MHNILTDEQLQEFNQLGYINLKGVIPLDVIEKAREAYERMRKKCEERTYPHARINSILSEKDVYGIEHIFHKDIFESDLFESLKESHVLEFSKQILGSEDVSLILNRIHCTRYQSHSGRWHRDGAPQTFMHVQSCIPLYPEAGFYVVPGSHHDSLEDVKDKKFNDKRHHVQGEIILPVEPGDLLLFHSSIFHRGTCVGREKYQRAHIHLRVALDKYIPQLARFKNEYWEHLADNKNIPSEWRLLFTKHMPEPKKYVGPVIHRDQSFIYLRRLKYRTLYYLSIFLSEDSKLITDNKIVFPYLRPNREFDKYF